MKDHLIFDTTDAISILDSDSVGAFVRGSDGTLIDKVTIAGVERLAVDSTLKDGAGTALTSTTIGADTGLDVNIIAGSLTVDVDLDHTTDSVALGDGTSLLTSTTVGADIGLDVYLLNTSISVTQGTSPWVIGDGGSSITVDATNLDIRDLTHVSDSVRLGDGTSFFTSTTIGSDIGLDVNVINDPALANTAILATPNVLDAADTAEAVLASALAARKYLFVYNNDNTKIFIGGSAVTALTGFPVSPGSYMELRAGANVSPYFVGQSGKTPAIRVLELS